MFYYASRSVCQEVSRREPISDWTFNILDLLIGTVSQDFVLDVTTGLGGQRPHVVASQFWAIDGDINLLYEIFDLVVTGRDTTAGLETASSFLRTLADALTYNNLYVDDVVATIGRPDYHWDSPNTTRLLSGTVWVEKDSVHVRWTWLTLPIALNVAGILYLALSVFYTRRHHLTLWKSSILATLYHGLHQNLLQPDQAYKRASDMVEAASALSVRLVP
ncbi:hypothetical protein AYL99_00484 [Fonsecaea erecta]|uniref:Uncharacterized protein n=1 Tax=Fonsecaea erecta TaxID=1367422 RepID=A0A178ZXU9_9EURO|nr:hypothetical protein AYL99_00484 [Fonsecaea erecta]OAP64512.1 hypothetical protein AYL99_00484 [Fonsecaea erecta]